MSAVATNGQIKGGQYYGGNQRPNQGRSVLRTEAFRHVQTSFIQVRNLVQAGPLLVGAIPPTNSEPAWIRCLPWTNKVSTYRKAL